MNKYRKNSISMSVVILVLFLVLSIVTKNWLFFLWSLIPAFLVMMTTFFIKKDK